MSSYGYGRRIAFEFRGQDWEAAHDAATSSVFKFERADEYEGLKQCFSAALPISAMRSHRALLEACKREMSAREEAREYALEDY